MSAAGRDAVVISTPASVIGGAATPDGTGGTSATAAACAWCGAAIDPAAPHPAGTRAVRELRLPDDVAAADGRRARSRLRDVVPARITGASRASATGCCVGCAPGSPAASTRSRPPGAVLDVGVGRRRAARRARRPRAPGARARARVPAPGRARRASWPTSSGPCAAVVLLALARASARCGRGARARGRPARAGRRRSWSRCRTRRACRRAPSATAGCTSTCRCHLVHVPAPALLARLRALGMRVERVSYLRGGQVVFGWLHGLVGLLPGHPDLYDAIRRPEARARRSTPARRGWRRSPPARSRSSRSRGVRRSSRPACVAAGTVYVEARRG